MFTTNSTLWQDINIEMDTDKLSPEGSRCFLANARSLKNKHQDFHASVFTEQFNIIAITKVWLDASVLNHKIIPSR